MTERALNPSVVSVRYRHLGARVWPTSIAPDLAKIPLDPLVSCLCVTENRQAFMPWVLWNFDRQTWRKRELVIVDSSDPPIRVPPRKDVRVLRVPKGTWLGKKRNLALEAARGQVVAWFDDDDWQHPRRLAFLIPALRKAATELGASFIGPSRSFFVDLHSGRCQPYDVRDYAIFNGSIYYTSMVKHAPFREDVLRNEDTLWISRLLRSRRGAALQGEQPTLFLWLTHDANISNQRQVRRCNGDGNAVLRAIGEAWTGTPQELAALRSRLSSNPAAQPLLAQREAALLRAREWQNRAYANPSLPSSPVLDASSQPAARPASADSGSSASSAPAAGATTVRAELARTARAARAASVPARATAPIVHGPKLALFAVSDGGPPVPAPDGFTAHHLSRPRFGVADALVALAVQRRGEWAGADYVGWFESRFLRDAGLARADFSAEISRTPQAADAYAHSTERGSLRRLAARISTNAERALSLMLVQHLRQPTALAEREISIVPWGFVARPRLLTHYVRDWLIPARTFLNDRNQPELEAWLGSGSSRDALVARLLGLLPSAFFFAEPCSLRAVALKPTRGRN